MNRTDVIIGISNLYPNWTFSRKAQPSLYAREQIQVGYNQAYLDTWTIRFNVGRKYEIELLIQVSDWDFIELPSVYVRSIPERAIENILPSPHLFLRPWVVDDKSYYYLCYALVNTISFDTDNKLSFIEYCFNQSKNIVTQLLTDQHYRAKDTMQEIVFLWGQIATHNSENYQYHLNNTTSIAANPKYSTDYGSTLFIDNDISGYHSVAVLNLLTKKPNVLCFVINLGSSYQSNCFPRQFINESSLNGIPFKTFGNWLKKISSSAHSQLGSAVFECINNPAKYKNDNNQYFTGCLIIDSETLSFRIDLSLLNKAYQDKERSHFSKNYRQQLLRQSRLFLLKSFNYTPHHIFERSIKNLEQPSLIDKKVLVIGCGAIGGYIALALARLGAGAKNGELTLIDNDELSPLNLGRHVLGRNYLYKNKAIVLKKEIENQLPNMNIKAYSNSILNEMNLMENIDLIIDATANSAVSQRINEAYYQSDKITAPIIHAWIRNNGECVQSLFYDRTVASACRSCLNKNGHHMRAGYDALVGDVNPITAIRACTDFTPYAVSSSMSTAALVTDIVLDWLKGDVSPRYRTRYNEKWHSNHLESSDFLPHEDCHVCARP